tara:strand:+ start:847 stop:1035 length:189 start_codon:yes stop_codon:yes gene_type:complete
MNPLKWIGELFVYRSPEPLEGYDRFLRYLTSKQLQKLAGTPSHYSKTILINMILDEYRRNQD